MVNEDVTREALLVAAREAWAIADGALTVGEAVIVGYSRLLGQPLDPCSWDDAPVILRADRLLDEGLGVVEAVRTAREEAVAWAIR